MFTLPRCAGHWPLGISLEQPYLATRLYVGNKRLNDLMRKPPTGEGVKMMGVVVTRSVIETFNLLGSVISAGRHYWNIIKIHRWAKIRRSRVVLIGKRGLHSKGDKLINKVRLTKEQKTMPIRLKEDDTKYVMAWNMSLTSVVNNRFSFFSPPTLIISILCQFFPFVVFIACVYLSLSLCFRALL